LVRELPPRSLFIIYAIFYWLIDSKPGGSGNIELATAGNIETWNIVGCRND